MISSWVPEVSVHGGSNHGRAGAGHLELGALMSCSWKQTHTWKVKGAERRRREERIVG